MSLPVQRTRKRCPRCFTWWQVTRNTISDNGSMRIDALEWWDEHDEHYVRRYGYGRFHQLRDTRNGGHGVYPAHVPGPLYLRDR